MGNGAQKPKTNPNLKKTLARNIEAYVYDIRPTTRSGTAKAAGVRPTTANPPQKSDNGMEASEANNRRSEFEEEERRKRLEEERRAQELEQERLAQKLEQERLAQEQERAERIRQAMQLDDERSRASEYKPLSSTASGNNRRGANNGTNASNHSKDNMSPRKNKLYMLRCERNKRSSNSPRGQHHCLACKELYESGWFVDGEHEHGSHPIKHVDHKRVERKHDVVQTENKREISRKRHDEMPTDAADDCKSNPQHKVSTCQLCQARPHWKHFADPLTSAPTVDNDSNYFPEHYLQGW